MKKVLSVVLFCFSATLFFATNANSATSGKASKTLDETDAELDDDESEDEEPPPPKKSGKKQKKIEVEETEKTIRFGVRGNIGMASTMLEVSKYDGSSESVGGGVTAGLGAFTLIPVWGIYFVPEISLQYREPVSDFYGITLKEIGIDIPLLFRFRYREENLIYLGIGPLLGCVLSSYYYADNGEYLNEKREKIDYGLAMELGFRINNNFSIDIRTLGSGASIGFTEYIDIPGDSGSLYQFQIGVNYTF